MKKVFSIILAALMLSSTVALTACSGGEAETEKETTGDTTVESTADTEPETEAETDAPETEAETDAPETEAETEPETEPEDEEEYLEEGVVFDQMSEWHYATYNCVYVGEEEGEDISVRHYEDDEMAEFIEANPEWYKDTAMMAQWDTAEAPFGDCISSMLAADTDFMLDPTNCNGIMFYKTFNIDGPIGENDLYEMYCFYDNTAYIYVNGELYFQMDSNLGIDGFNDWNGGVDLIEGNVDTTKALKDYLHEGENYIAVSIKNAWGGREFEMSLSVEKDSTKESVSYFERGSEWHYTVLSCPYTDGEGTIDGEVSGGFFDEATDEMAKFLADNPNFMTDTELLSSWPTETGSFGSKMDAIGWTGSNHGLILYKTFTVEDLETIKGCDDFQWDCAYDNAIHVYLNGTEVYTDDGECVVQDWNDGKFLLDHDQVASLLVEGENYFVVTIKDAWGGRNFDAGFSAEWY